MADEYELAKQILEKREAARAAQEAARNGIRPGYDASGFKLAGIDQQKIRDSEQSRITGQAKENQYALRNAKKAMRAGNGNAWAFWQSVAGGRTFTGIPQADENNGIAKEVVNQKMQIGLNANPNARPEPANPNATPVTNRPEGSSLTPGGYATKGSHTPLKNPGDQASRNGLAADAQKMVPASADSQDAQDAMFSSTIEDSEKASANPLGSPQGSLASPAGQSPSKSITTQPQGSRTRGMPDFQKAAQDAFRSDLERSQLIAEGRGGYDLTPERKAQVEAAQQKALERGLSLGGDREKLQAMIGMETDSQKKDQYAESEAKTQRAIDNIADPVKREQMRKISARLTPQERKEASIKGRLAGEEYRRKTDSAIERARSVMDEAKQTIFGASANLQDAQIARDQFARNNGIGKTKPLDQDVPERRLVDQMKPSAELFGKTSGSNDLPDNVMSDSFFDTQIKKFDPSISSKTSKTSPLSKSVSNIDKATEWLKPGYNPYEAKKGLVEIHGYTPEEADKMIQGRGVTKEAYAKKVLSDKQSETDWKEKNKKLQDMEFQDSVRNSPEPKAPDWMRGSYLEKAYLGVIDPGGYRKKEFDRQKEEKRKAEEASKRVSISMNHVIKARETVGSIWGSGYA